MSRVAHYGELSHDEGLSTFFSSVFNVMGLGLAVTGLTAWWISHDMTLMTSLFNIVEYTTENGEPATTFSASGWWFLCAVLQLGMVLVISLTGLSASLNMGAGILLFALYALLSGITLAPLIYAYTDVSVFYIFFMAGAMFGICALWGHTTKKDMTGMGTFFMMGLVGLLIAMLVNIFMGFAFMDFVISVVAVVLFAGLTAYDMQKLRKMYYDGVGYGGGLVVFGALTLYLDFINMFIHLLRIFGNQKD